MTRPDSTSLSCQAADSIRQIGFEYRRTPGKTDHIVLVARPGATV